ncbi:type II toxin-antitoxin system RelE/ParE family toxin [Rhizobium sp. SSA_523]|uniref:type II toxin-antitoxin system RelE family toxin n=1 Tax=Rhizobium sp. SSA_523 TaxID=2952477 RepID=UPI002091A94F|nr:type II toxin-antitoxin system RelE/ParE family toxin [Rhizobium sp. SSA_523]MCO5733171.1 type II toxin-antitoxin system RelE/ParE family toxin [Rhizobium sp. SSA_523]WKC24041.1 type II toxin-antitoxin system RelE/ParE family toxin [Rhizobium sp. SSA_523]
MAWTIEFDTKAIKQLQKMGDREARRVRDYLHERIKPLDNPRDAGLAMQGTKFAHLWRYKVGDYRIICEIKDKKLIVLVVEVGHRREIYR